MSQNSMSPIGRHRLRHRFFCRSCYRSLFEPVITQERPKRQIKCRGNCMRSYATFIKPENSMINLFGFFMRRCVCHDCILSFYGCIDNSIIHNITDWSQYSVCVAVGKVRPCYETQLQE
jgi:hypothetical protein